MNDRAAISAQPDVASASIVSGEQARPHLTSRPWYRAIGPALLGLFVWGPFFDQLWVSDITRLGLAGMAGTAVLAACLCCGVFLAMAGWGLRARRPLRIVASSTFGASGSEWIVGIGIAVASIGWYAVAVDYAVSSTLLGLRAFGLIAPSALRDWILGPVSIKSTVYICTAVFWIYITGTAVLMRLPTVVVALMKVYAPVALVLLIGVAIYRLPSADPVGIERAQAIAAAGGMLGRSHGPGAIQVFCGFFAVVSLLSVDWGAVTKSRSDVVQSGLVVIVGAGTLTATASLLVIAGVASAFLENSATFVHAVGDPIPLSFRWAVLHGLGGLPAGTVLVLFGLASLAPAVYSAWFFSERLAAHWPGVRPSRWTWIGAAGAFVLMMTSLSDHLGLFASVMGDLFAPAAGALLADRLRQRGGWSGPRAGFNPAGIIAWASGSALALAVDAANLNQADGSVWLRLASIYGFLAAAAVYELAARGGLERAVDRIQAAEVDR